MICCSMLALLGQCLSYSNDVRNAAEVVHDDILPTVPGVTKMAEMTMNSQCKLIWVKKRTLQMIPSQSLNCSLDLFSLHPDSVLSGIPSTIFDEF